MSGPLSLLKPVSRAPANAAIPSYSVWTNQVRGLDKDWPSNLMLGLMKISEEVKLFDQAFSPMAKRNVAMSMLGRITEFEKAWKAAYRVVPLPRQLADLGAAARKQADVGVSANKYGYVSCIGYGVKTGKFDEHHFKATWSSAKGMWERKGMVRYSGDKSDSLDYIARCNALRQAIDTAHGEYQTTHGSNPSDSRTLKVFMAPEFYFRGRQGAYDISAVSEIFGNLRSYTCDARFKDWLFVFGTVIGASYDDRLVCEDCGAQGADQFVRTGLNQFTCEGCSPGSVVEERFGARIDNVALIQKGGEDDLKNAHVIEKEYVSHIDFRRYASPRMLNKGKLKTGKDNTAILDDWSSDRRIAIMKGITPALPPSGSRDLGGGGSKFHDERMGGSIFTIDGIKFGLEICLDHLKGRIASGTGIQIQLVPSAGASLKKLVCVTDGIGFNVDGLSGKCDAQVNASGGPTTLTPTSATAPSGGEIKIFAPQLIPYA